MPGMEEHTLKGDIYKHILNKIMSRELLLGEKIPEAQLASELQVSKTPVRWALQKLSWEGIVDININRSATVSVLDKDLIKDLASVRWQHEKLNIPLVIYNGSNRDFDDLEVLAERCIYFNNKGDMNGRHKYDARFHLKLYEIGNNKILYQLHRNLGLIIQLWQVSTVLHPEQQKDGLMQHFELLDALRARDEAAALEISYKHYTMAYGVSFDK